MRRACLPTALGWLLFALASMPQARDGEDKSQYSLANPTPDHLLREFDPDRPGQSHDAKTVDAGRFQLEAGLFEHVHDPRGPGSVSTRRYTYGNPMLRVGITPDTEVQIAAPLHVLSRSGGAESERAAGAGDVTLATKSNLVGNDGGPHVLAILPTIKVPTAAPGIGNGHVEATIYLPYNYQITKEVTLTVEPSIGALRNDANTRYHDSYGFNLGVDWTIAKVLIASVEVSVQGSSARKEATLYALGPSLAYLVTKSLQLDAGVILGLNKATPRYNPYLGVSYRF